MNHPLHDAIRRQANPRTILVLIGALVALVLAAACAPVAAPPVTSAPPTAAAAQATSAPEATTAPAASNFADKKVGMSNPFEVEILNDFINDMQKEAQQPQVAMKIDIVNANSDPVKQQADLEAFLAQGYNGIFFLTLAPGGGIDEFVKRATDQGVCVFNHSASPVTGATQNVVLDQYASGYESGRDAAEWINAHGGDLEVAFLTNIEDPNLQQRSQGQKDAIKELAPNAKVVGEVVANTIELGAEGAANLLQANPNLSVILAFSDDGGLGAYQAATEAGKTDPETFYIGSLDGIGLVFDRIAEKGIYQSTWSYLFPFSSVAWVRDMEKCLMGEKVPPTRTQIGRIVTLENLEEVRTMGSNPLDPSVQKFYDDPGVMKYSDEGLTSPK